MSDKLDLSKFRKTLPDELIEFLSILKEDDFYLTLVGGAVRDYILYKTLSKDLDFEIRTKKDISNKDWEDELKKLILKISKRDDVKVEKLRFNIYRIQFKSIEMEVSSPRVEKYKKDTTNFGHSDFDAYFSSSFTYEESFSRRDFSINAMGIELRDNYHFIDPFDGFESSIHKELNYITDDFFKDPVRLLRTLRFKVQHNLNLSRKLKDDIIYFNLDKLSLHYFVQEGKKIGLEKLAYEMEFSKRKFSLKLPSWAKAFKQMNFETYGVCKELIDLVMEFAGQSEATDDCIMAVSNEFSIKKSKVKSILLIRKLNEIDFDTLKKELLKEGFSNSLMNKDFQYICKLFKSFNSMDKTVLNFFINSKINSILLSEIEEDDLFREISPTIKQDKISMLGIYCHLIKKI